MRATITVEDNIITVDGQWRRVDCSPLIADGIRAVQWHGEIGEVEFVTVMDAENTPTRKPNETITDFSPYQTYIDQWTVENAKQSLIEAAQQKEMADNKEAAAKDNLRLAAWMRLPQAERDRLAEAKQSDAQERAELIERQRLEAWEKLSADEQRQVIEDASP
jgi:hypothetical protein